MRPSPSHVLRVLLLLGAGAAAACSGPPVPTPLEFEPVCAGYKDKAGQPMLGGMRVPVVLTLKDGAGHEAQRVTLLGLPGPTAPKTPILLPDKDAEYAVEWAQCANKRPERPLAAGPDTAWQCGEATVYKTAKLVTKKGDLGTHKLAFAVPPDATCWIGELPPVP
jgi:hypothetical protein